MTKAEIKLIKKHLIGSKMSWLECHARKQKTKVRVHHVKAKTVCHKQEEQLDQEMCKKEMIFKKTECSKVMIKFYILI